MSWLWLWFCCEERWGCLLVSREMYIKRITYQNNNQKRRWVWWDLVSREMYIKSDKWYTIFPALHSCHYKHMTLHDTTTHKWYNFVLFSTRDTTRTIPLHRHTSFTCLNECCCSNIKLSKRVFNLDKVAARLITINATFSIHFKRSKIRGFDGNELCHYLIITRHCSLSLLSLCQNKQPLNESLINY